MGESILQLENVTKRYDAPGGEGEATTVLAGVDMTVQTGESLAVVGPSGCGKSTLLNLMGALDRPTSGTVHLNGRDLADLSDAELAAIRNREIGFIFQLHHLLPQCTILENVLVPTLATGGGKNPDAADRARELLQRVGLGERTDHRPGQLSGGELQRAAVVRAMINRPRLLLADEPTGSLDRKASENLADLLVELNREQDVTLIVVTHATHLAGRMETQYHLEEGHLRPAGKEEVTR